MSGIERAIVHSLEQAFAGHAVPRLSELVIPPAGSDDRRSPFTFVILDEGSVGISWNLLEEDQERARFDGLPGDHLAGRGALEVAAGFASDDRLERILGYAACNALSHHLYRQGRLEPEFDVDLFDLAQLSPEDHLGIVGYSPPLVHRAAN